MKPKVTLITIVLLLAAALSMSNQSTTTKNKQRPKPLLLNFTNGITIATSNNLRTLRRQTWSGPTQEQFLAEAAKTMNEWGKLQTTRLDQAKVFPSNPVQVKMLYKSTFEKGNAQEWFTWNIYGDDVRLFEYNVTPGWDK
jgi:hypothetical protein